MAMVDVVGIAKDRFEEYGIALQETANTADKAKERLDQSCLRCTLYKRQAECETCPIRMAAVGNAKMRGFPMDYTWNFD